MTETSSIQLFSPYYESSIVSFNSISCYAKNNKSTFIKVRGKQIPFTIQGNLAKMFEKYYLEWSEKLHEEEIW